MTNRRILSYCANACHLVATALAVVKGRYQFELTRLLAAPSDAMQVMQCKSCNASLAITEPFVGKRISLEEKLQLGKGTPQRRITSMGRYLLLWLLGVPIPILILIWVFGGLH